MTANGDDDERGRDLHDDERIAEGFILFGHSWGASIALEYAVMHPEKLDGLILCSSSAALYYTEEAVGLARARATDQQFDALLRALSSPAPDDEALRDRWLATLPIYF